MSMAWIRKNYNVPAKRGSRVEYSGDNGPARFGTIIRSDGPRLRIRLDGDDWAGAYHPTWALQYLEPSEGYPEHRKMELATQESR